MGILVLYKNNVYDIVADEHLDQLIADHRIIGFHRSMEWVQIGRDPLRRKNCDHGAHERRRRVSAALALPGTIPYGS
jgi:hypothetical protein